MTDKHIKKVLAKTNFQKSLLFFYYVIKLHVTFLNECKIILHIIAWWNSYKLIKIGVFIIRKILIRFLIKLWQEISHSRNRDNLKEKIYSNNGWNIIIDYALHNYALSIIMELNMKQGIILCYILSKTFSIMCKCLPYNENFGHGKQ